MKMFVDLLLVLVVLVPIKPPCRCNTICAVSERYCPPDRVPRPCSETVLVVTPLLVKLRLRSHSDTAVLAQALVDERDLVGCAF